MDDRALMEDLLLVTKGVCDLYMHGTIESATANVHCAFDKALKDSLTMQDNILTTFSDSLNDSLAMQSEIYKTMEQKGWYQSDPADITKIKKAYNKFTTQA